MRLSKRLGFTHGALVALLVLLLVVTLQGLLRMLGVMTGLAEERLSTLDAEEEIHRSSWNIEVSLRHARLRCADGASDAVARERISSARAAFESVIARQARATPAHLGDAARRYGVLADDVLASPQTCVFLAQDSTEERRMKLDEEMTDAWIERLHELHADMEVKETSARMIGNRTAMSGLIVALLGAVSAVYIARITARSVTRPIARLGEDATRLGDGDFAPIVAVEGPPEVEELRANLERTREKLLGLDRLKRAFLAGVSHELRSPLGRLREALALLADGTVGALTAKQDRVLKLARRACEQEVRIVEALLDMSRVSTGLPMHREAGCDLGRVVEAAVEAERETAAERDVTIALSRVTQPPTLRLDSALVERAVANLVRNAASVSQRGSTVRVAIDTVVRDDGRRYARVDVIDDGPGVAAEVAKRIFQPFNASHVGDRPAGIGIGLSLARDVAQAHGGDLVLAAGEAATTFRMELPVEVEEI